MLQHRKLRLPALLTAVVMAVTLTACSGESAEDESAGGGSGETSETAYNDADVEFATAMIPHHAQAIEMVTLTQGRSLDPKVARLAEGVRDAQVPEVETMTDWLTSWGQEVPETSLDHANAGHGMEGTEGGGMMSAEDMESLRKAPDKDFQRMWLEMMIAHHEGAIEMAEAEVEDGRYAEAVAMAESIVTSQSAEIDRIEKLLTD